VAAMIVTNGVSGGIFDASIAHALCTSNRTEARPFVILFGMRNPMAVTIEGRRDYVKRKRKFHAVLVKYTKCNSIPWPSLIFIVDIK
jgi:hypothetical protein